MRTPGRRDRFTANLEKAEELRRSEAAGEVVDSMDVRVALIQRMFAGELTLEQVQAEVKRIKREAARNGKVTRAQARRRG